MHLKGLSMLDILDGRLGMLLTANVGAVGVTNLLSHMDSVLHLLLSVGQLGIAVVTIIYVIKKIRALPKKEDGADDKTKVEN